MTTDKSKVASLLFDVESYIKAREWRKIEVGNTKLRVFEPITDYSSEIKLVLPASAEFDDAYRRIESVIHTLAEIEGKNYVQFRKSIETYNKDSLQFKILTERSSDSIPLAYAKTQVAGMEKLLLYAASSEKEELRHHSTPSSGALTFLEDCEFGHTFRGSFGFTVLLRVAERNANIDMLDFPITRKIVERVGRGIKSLAEAIESKSINPIVDSYASGFNSRMCDALVDISASGRCNYAVDIDWAMAIPPAEEFHGQCSIEIDTGAIELLDEASRELKRVPPEPYIIEAYISDLHCVRDPHEDGVNRKITLLHKHSEYGRIEVAVELGKDDYILAVEAHRDRRMLSVTGKLQRIGSSWSLIEMKVFRVLGGNLP